MVFNTTFNNIYIVAVSFIGGGNGVPGENHRPVDSHWQIVSHNIVSSTPSHEQGSNSQLKKFNSDRNWLHM
jgi:hypothetical protein